MYRSRHFQFDFRTAYVITIPYTLSPKSFKEFCPIFFLSVFSKLFEKILEKNVQICSKNSISIPFRFVFGENNSIELAMTTFYDKLLKNLEKTR